MTDFFPGQYSGQTNPHHQAVDRSHRNDSPSPALLSVVIWTCNRPDMLEQCLEGFKRQRLEPSRFEIVVVECGPKPNELAGRFGDGMQVRCIHQQDAGVAAARNIAIEAAKGNVIFPFNDENFPHPDCLTRHYDFHLASPSVEDAMLGFMEWKPGLEITPLMHYVTEVDPRLWSYKNIQHGHLMPFGCLWWGCSSYKKELIQKAGGFNPHFSFGLENTEAEFRMRQHGLRVHFDRQAINYASRPVDYEEFCNLSYERGKLFWRLQQLYAGSQPIQEYTSIGNPRDAISNYRKVADSIDSIKKMLSKGWSLPQAGAEPPTLDLLYSCLHASFEYWKNKGILDEIQGQEGPRADHSLSIDRHGTASKDAAHNIGKKLQSSLPLVSVVIPTYNRPEQLVGAIRSVQEQTYENIEIIVVNDCGTEIGDIVTSMNDKNNITYCRHAVHSGPAAARNTAIKLSKGTYIAYLDDDDIFYPDHVETLASFLTNSGHKVAYTNAVKAHQVKLDGKYVTTRKEPAYTSDFDNDLILLTNLIPVQSVMHEKSCVDAVGLWDETLTTLEDWDLWIRMSRKYEFVHIPEVTSEVTWRTDGTTTTSSRFPDFLRTQKIIFEKHREFADGKPKVLEARQTILQDIEERLGKPRTTSPTDPVTSAVRAPDASIIILTRNQLHFTVQCLESIRRYTGLPHEIIIVDNNSTDNTPEFLRQFSKDNSNAKIIFNKSNRGFAAGNNQGLSLASAEYLVLLNNDTVVTPGWLERMIEVLRSFPRAGMVGPMSNFVAPPQWVSEITYRTADELEDFARRWAAQHAGQTQTVHRLIAFCMAIRKEVVEKIGGLDESFGLGNFEDDDYCVRAWLSGFESIIAKDVFIHHTGSVTLQQEGLFHKASFLRNWELFKAKWAIPAHTTIEDGYVLDERMRRASPACIPLRDIGIEHAADSTGKYWHEIGQSV